MRARKCPAFIEEPLSHDATLRFEKYPEDAAAAALYGTETEDPLGHLFPGFDYTR
jgi:hypothetical protein